MHGVIKIHLFLFTFTQQILGSTQVKEHFHACVGSLKSRPIATDLEMHYTASNAIGTANSLPLSTTAQPHHSGMALHLTDPNLDPMATEHVCSQHQAISHNIQMDTTPDWAFHSVPPFTCTCPWGSSGKLYYYSLTALPHARHV